MQQKTINAINLGGVALAELGIASQLNQGVWYGAILTWILCIGAILLVILAIVEGFGKKK